jgi:hypothetical protein
MEGFHSIRQAEDRQRSDRGFENVEGQTVIDRTMRPNWDGKCNKAFVRGRVERREKGEWLRLIEGIIGIANRNVKDEARDFLEMGLKVRGIGPSDRDVPSHPKVTVEAGLKSGRLNQNLIVIFDCICAKSNFFNDESLHFTYRTPSFESRCAPKSR